MLAIDEAAFKRRQLKSGKHLEYEGVYEIVVCDVIEKYM